MLEEAASAYRAALTAQPAQAAPLETAKTHINLAYTWELCGTGRETGPASSE